MNLDQRTVDGFGEEWSLFDQARLDRVERQNLFERYFRIFDWERLPASAEGFDLGCGSGRWAQLVAPRVRTLHCIDASTLALDVARRNLANHTNCQFHLASVDQMPLADGSMDFGYSLGVLHHLPDTQAGLTACVAKLRNNAPFLLYLYYAFDNKPRSYRLLWHASDMVRRFVCRLPSRLRMWITQVIAAIVYWPLARTARLLERLSWDVSGLPLAFYRHLSFYTMRTDALDRFGTPVEQRFTRDQIYRMMENAGLEAIQFSDEPPFWCAVGRRRLSRSLK